MSCCFHFQQLCPHISCTPFCGHCEPCPSVNHCYNWGCYDMLKSNLYYDLYFFTFKLYTGHDLQAFLSQNKLGQPKSCTVHPPQIQSCGNIYNGGSRGWQGAHCPIISFCPFLSFCTLIFWSPDLISIFWVK